MVWHFFFVEKSAYHGVFVGECDCYHVDICIFVLSFNMHQRNDNFIFLYYCEIIINRGVLIFADFVVHLNQIQFSH